MRSWKRLHSRPVLENRWLRVTADRCELPSGTVIEPYFVIHEPEWVHVLAINDEKKILVVRQYRYAGNAFCTELPGGVVDAGEEPIEAAKRELLEETGVHAENWQSIGSLFANPARQTNRIHLFVGSGLTEVSAQKLDASEEIAFQFMSVSQVEQAIQDGEFSQSLHVASFYRAIHFLKARGAA